MTTRYIDRPSQFLIENLEILFLYIGEPRMLPELVFEPFAYVLINMYNRICSTKMLFKQKKRGEWK